MPAGDRVSIQVRTGIARFSDGWNVVVEIDGEPTVWDPTFATEAEAEAKRAEMSAYLRRQARDRGLLVEGKF
jgi:hypothetical protein